MWLISQHGFFSITQARGKDEDRLMFRARDPQDLENLRERFKHIPAVALAEVHEDRAADYRWRVFLPKSVGSTIVAEMVEEIDYGNFKSRITAKQGAYRHDIYMSIWGTLMRIQRDLTGKVLPKSDRRALRESTGNPTWWNERHTNDLLPLMTEDEYRSQREFHDKINRVRDASPRRTEPDTQMRLGLDPVPKRRSKKSRYA
jgi:hypothetical protein